MSKITSVSAQKNNKERCNIYVDGEFYLGVPTEAVLALRIKVGMDITAEQLVQLKEYSERAEAFEKALSYISMALKTKRQVRDYLTRKGYAYSVAMYVVDRLCQMKYLDDVAYSEKYIESTMAKQGKRLATYKLMQKGVKKADIENAYENNPVCQEEHAKSVAIKRLKGKEITRELIAKTFRYLLGRGFSYEEAEFALKDYKEEF